MRMQLVSRSINSEPLNLIASPLAAFLSRQVERLLSSFAPCHRRRFLRSEAHNLRITTPIAIAGVVVVATLSVLGPSEALAEEGTVSVRGAYYKERSTRVAQPMIDTNLKTSEHGTVVGHFLIDSITSASVAAGAASDAFTETRYEFGGNYSHELKTFRLGGGARLSYEPDYFSVFGSLRGEIDLAEKNATAGLALAVGRDAISNAGLQGGMAPEISESLTTALASASFSQILTPNMIASITYDFIYMKGYQANVYRSVPAGGSFAAERVPDKRVRNAAAASLKSYIEPTKTTVIASYRFYFDDWGVLGHTPEIRLVQEVGSDLEMHLRYRLYRQSAADFFQQVYDTADPAMQPFITADQKLAKQTTQAFGVKGDAALSLFGVGGRMEKARLSVMFEFTKQTTTFGNAIASQVALTVPFDIGGAR